MDYLIVRTDELSHHGILGQKWGVRRYQNKDGTRTAAGKKHEAAIRETDSMSDEELRNKVNRMRNEETYQRLTSNKQSSKLSSGLKTASNVLQIGSSLAEIGSGISNASRPTNKQIGKDPSLSTEQKKLLVKINKDHEDRQKAIKGTLNNTRTIVDETNKIHDVTSKARNTSKAASDLSKMSDAELKKRIDRLMLEEQYDRMISSKHVNKGEKFTNTVLPAISSTVAIAGSVTSLTLTILKLTGKLG